MDIDLMTFIDIAFGSLSCMRTKFLAATDIVVVLLLLLLSCCCCCFHAAVVVVRHFQKSSLAPFWLSMKKVQAKKEEI